MTHSTLPRSPFRPLAVLVVLALVAACSGDRPDALAPTDVGGPVFDLQVSPEQLGAAFVAQEAITPSLMANDNVVGTGVGVTSDGRPAIKVFLRTASAAGIPTSWAGFPVEIMVTGDIVSLALLAQQQAQMGPPPGKGPKNDVDHTARERPAGLGMSTGHPAITACSIGARLAIGGAAVVLSNNHCYAASNFLGCSPTANYSCTLGDPVIQPGTFDGGSVPGDVIGNVIDYQPIVFSTAANNVMDAAIASTTTAMVDNASTSDCYGTPQTQTLVAAVNMEVQKCGRTTEHTSGTITAINATVNVGYGVGVARFVGQIVTTAMSQGGDSGSLLVARGKGKNKADNGKPVGLLFAGSLFTTIHNPINAVLTRFGATVDGT